MKLYLDPGHGGADPGAQGNGLKEKDIVLDIALRIQKILLNDYENIEVKMSRTSDIFISLDQRTKEANAWGADYYLSIHCNSADGTAQGYEDYIHDKLSDSSTTAKYQEIMHAEIIKVNQLKERGARKANFHVLRETSMPALLTENGFINNEHDSSLMKESLWLQKVAQGHVNGLKRIFNLQRKSTKPESKPEPKSATRYKVIAGSFKLKENATERVAYFHSKRIESFIDTIHVSGEVRYRIQVGSFYNRENAENKLAEIKNIGIKDAFIEAEDINA